MESVGTRLKNKRLEKGLTLEEVQKRTKIHLNILRSIEDDSLVGVSPIYVKGFLKIYCKFLGLNPREFIPDYKEPQARSPFSAVADSKSPAPQNLSFTKFVAYLPRIRPKTIFTIVIVIAGLIILFQSGKWFSHRRHAGLLKRQEAIAIALKTERKPQSQPEKSQKVAVAGNLLKLGVHARENCYLSLKTDGRLVFQGLFRKGIAESWQAKEKIEFSLNNAGVVDLQVNGRPISGLGRRGQALRGIVTREEGLKIL